MCENCLERPWKITMRDHQMTVPLNIQTRASDRSVNIAMGMLRGQLGTECISEDTKAEREAGG